MPRAYFTETGLGALRRLASDRRYMDPHKFAHVRTELGLPRSSDVTSSSHMEARVQRKGDHDTGDAMAQVDRRLKER